MRPFQIISNPTSAAELARMPKELELQILGEFRGLPQQVMQAELDQFGKLERAGRMQEDEALQQNPKFWELIEEAKGTTQRADLRRQ